MTLLVPGARLGAGEYRLEVLHLRDDTGAALLDSRFKVVAR